MNVSQFGKHVNIYDEYHNKYRPYTILICYMEIQRTRFNQILRYIAKQSDDDLKDILMEIIDYVDPDNTYLFETRLKKIYDVDEKKDEKQMAKPTFFQQQSSNLSFQGKNFDPAPLCNPKKISAPFLKVILDDGPSPQPSSYTTPV